MRIAKWYENLASPWDHDCRGKFELLSFKYPLGGFYESDDIETYHKFSSFIYQVLTDSGQLDWLISNEVDLKTLKFAGFVKQDTYELSVKVLVDLPTKLRTMYALRFN